MERQRGHVASVFTLHCHARNGARYTKRQSGNVAALRAPVIFNQRVCMCEEIWQRYISTGAFSCF